ncbi:MAG: glycoside hydrolase family 3 C-terminal domain-containing protein, partial [Oscillospiraceae bacterium]
YSGDENALQIVNAVEEGALSENALDAACWNMLRLIFKYAQPEKPHSLLPQLTKELADKLTRTPSAEHQTMHQLAADALTKSAVLLKNDTMLPLKESDNIAVIGQMAKRPQMQGGGSSVIHTLWADSFTGILDSKNIPYLYSPGYTRDKTNKKMLADAVDKAKKASQVLLFLGLLPTDACEGIDRSHLRLPDGQLELLKAVSAANKNTCVVLHTGGPVEMSWLSSVRSVLCLHLGGEATGEAAFRLLYGKDNPSGKLTETWPLKLQDTPAFEHFPMGPNIVTYNESLYVGYRYYNKANIPVLFPFGYGLSYTAFAYSNLLIAENNIGKNQPLKLSFTLQNTGDVYGEETAQVYLARKNSSHWQPEQELKSFCKIALQPGESKQVEVEIAYKDLGFYAPDVHAHVVEGDTFECRVGNSSADTPLRGTFEVEGETLTPSLPFSAQSVYAQVTNNQFNSDDFVMLMGGHPLPHNTAPQKGNYDLTTPVCQMESGWGRFFRWVICKIAAFSIGFSGDSKSNRIAGRAAGNDLPLKSPPSFSGGLISHRTAAAMLDLANGKGSFFKLLGSLSKKSVDAKVEEAQQKYLYKK